jgi:hypothetical protein
VKAWWWFLPVCVMAQEPDTLTLQEDDPGPLEEFVETDQEGVEDDQIIEWTEHFRRNPVNLNRASRPELESVPGMTSYLAAQILTYRKSTKFVTVRDLLKVEGMTREDFVRIQEFVAVDPEDAVKKYDVSVRQRARRQVERSVNFRNGTYDGDPYQMYHRVIMKAQPHPVRQPDHVISSGWVLEKDPGETRLGDQRSLYFMADDLPGIRRLIAGHYQVEFGQALNLWSGSGFSKSSEVIDPVKKRDRGLSPYHYAGENAAFFGAAAEFKPVAGIGVTVFGAQTRFDASVNDDGTANSILLDGYHRTATEIDRRNNLREKLLGVNATLYQGQHRIGTTFHKSWYNRNFVTTDSVRNRFRFTGSENSVFSVFGDFYWDTRNIYGEWARDPSGDMAAIAGYKESWENLEWVLSVRHYERDFQNLHAYAFGEQNGRTQNEDGVYAGLKWKVSRRFQMQSYYDVYRFPWRTFDVPGRVRGDDFLTEWNLRPFRLSEITLRYKQERKDDVATTVDELGRDVTVIERRVTRRARAQWDYDLTAAVRWRTRAEWVWTDIPSLAGYDRKGVAFYQDVRYRATSRLTLYGRLSFFDTDDFATAVYEYENDVHGVFSNTALSGKGSRWYLLAVYRIGSRLDVSAKFWQLYRDDLDNIGSGGDTISGNVLTRWTLALNVRL